MKAPKSNRLVCKKQVSAQQSSPRKSQEKWGADCILQCSKTIDREMAYKLSFNSTKVTKLIIFQSKLLHRFLATNDFLNKVGIRENDICTFKNWLAENQIKLKSNIFTPDIIIGLSNIKQYFYFLVARYYIWSCKIKEGLPKIERFSSFLSSLVQLDS